MTIKSRSAWNGSGLRAGHSTRPALTRLAVLAAANPTVAATLLNNPVAAATSHPHYSIALDAIDRAILVDIHARARTVDEFLAKLAQAVDDSASLASEDSGS